MNVVEIFRVGKNRLIKAGILEQYVEGAARLVRGQAGILILLDSDDDCPAELGPQLLDRALKQRSDVPQAVVLAKREFEAWFIAAAESLRGRMDFPVDLEVPSDPERIRGAKEWLGRRWARTRPYTPSRHQAELTRIFDLDLAKSSRSFEKCYREIARLLTTPTKPLPACPYDGPPEAQAQHRRCGQET